MIKRRTFQTMLCALIGLFMIVMTGCQAVGGLDINKALVSGLDVTSSEGSMSISVHMMTDNSSIRDPEAAKLLQLFNGAKLKVHSMKMQDVRTLSMKGDFSFSKGSIPFQLYMNKDKYVVQLEGVNKPIVFDVAGGANLPPEAKAIQDKLIENSQPISKAVASFLVPNLPNPKVITVQQVTEKVHNEDVNLRQIHAEIYGNEAVGLVKQLLVNMSKDEKGIKELISQLYDILAPILKEVAAQASKDAKEADATVALLNNYLNNKALAVEFLYTTIKTYLDKAVAGFDEFAAGVQPAGDHPFTDKSYVKADIYVDDQMQQRKTNYEIALAFGRPSDDGVQGVKITATSEVWNMNAPVTADVIDTAAGAIEVGPDTTARKFLNQVDRNSLLYDLLKNDLHVTRKNITMMMDDSNEEGFNKPYIKNDYTLVPVRFVSEQLDADVEWDSQNKRVTITDDLLNRVIVLTIGSKTAYVDGKLVKLETEAELKDGATYVPVRFIAENLGAEVGWDSTIRMITITRDE